MRNFLVGLIVLALVPATSYAGGGGGTKGVTSKITVVNQGSDRLAVIVDAPKGFDPKKNTVSQFQAAGGKIIELGGSITVNAKEGDHKFGCAFVSTNGVIGKNFTQNYHVPKNSTVNVEAIGNYPFTPTVNVTTK